MTEKHGVEFTAVHKKYRAEYIETKKLGSTSIGTVWAFFRSSPGSSWCLMVELFVKASETPNAALWGFLEKARGEK